MPRDPTDGPDPSRRGPGRPLVVLVVRIILALGLALPVAWLIDWLESHPVCDDLEKANRGLERWNERLKKDPRARERGALWIMQARLLGKPEADAVAVFGHPIAVQTEIRQGKQVRTMIFPSPMRESERVEVECVDGVSGVFPSLLDRRQRR